MRLMNQVAHLPDARALRVTRPKNKTLHTVADRGEELLIVFEIIFKVGVLNENDIAGREREPVPYGVPLSGRPILKQETNPGCSAKRSTSSRVPSVELLSTRQISISKPGIILATRSSITLRKDAHSL